MNTKKLDHNRINKEVAKIIKKIIRRVETGKPEIFNVASDPDYKPRFVNGKFVR